MNPLVFTPDTQSYYGVERVCGEGLLGGQDALTRTAFYHAHTSFQRDVNGGGAVQNGWTVRRPSTSALLALPPSEEIADSPVKFSVWVMKLKWPAPAMMWIVAPGSSSAESDVPSKVILFFSGFDDQNTAVPTGRRRQLVPEIEHDTQLLRKPRLGFITSDLFYVRHPELTSDSGTVCKRRSNLERIADASTDCGKTIATGSRILMRSIRPGV